MDDRKIVFWMYECILCNNCGGKVQIYLGYWACKWITVSWFQSVSHFIYCLSIAGLKEAPTHRMVTIHHPIHTNGQLRVVSWLNPHVFGLSEETYPDETHAPGEHTNLTQKGTLGRSRTAQCHPVGTFSGTQKCFYDVDLTGKNKSIQSLQ